MIKLHNKHFKPFISAFEIDTAIAKMAERISADYQDKVPVFVAVLNGAFMFVADFVRKYPGDCEICFVKLASYEGIKSTEKVQELIGINQDLSGREVIVLEDIVDTGTTLVALQQIFSKQNVKNVKVAALFYKPEAYKQSIQIHYIGMEIPNRFIVGFGLDYDGLGRNLPQIYQLKENRMINLVLFGKPGAGKGTQAQFLKEKYNLKHISTGDVFRDNIKNSTALGKLAQSYMDKGDLVPDEVTIQMLQDEVEKNPEAAGFIFDGFPRTTAQAEALDNLLKQKGMQVDATIALDVDDEALIKRLLDRGKTSGRSDDQDEQKIRNRFDEYNQKTALLANYYRNQNKFYSINGIGEVKEITVRLSDVIENL